MSFRNAVEKMAEEVGFDIGQGSDLSQAMLFVGLAKAFSKYVQHHQLELQAGYAAHEFEKLLPRYRTTERDALSCFLKMLMLELNQAGEG